MLKLPKTGRLLGWERGGDDIFCIESRANRDDCLEPYRKLRSSLRKVGVALHTADVSESTPLEADFDLYIQAEQIRDRARRNYFISLEPPVISPESSDPNYLSQFDLVFTWNKKLLNNEALKNRMIEVRMPNTPPPEFFEQRPPSWGDRPLELCMINSNKAAPSHSDQELYSARIAIIRWLEKNFSQNFKLYGQGWQHPSRVKRNESLFQYKIEKLFHTIFRSKPFPSFFGGVKRKYETLSTSKFSICFENSRGPEGYISEKIFDCFFGGCIPIYLGDPSISDYIPAECFVDVSHYKTYEELFKYVKAIDERKFTMMQSAAREFISSIMFYPFSSDSFSKTIADAIRRDLDSHRPDFNLF